MIDRTISLWIVPAIGIVLVGLPGCREQEREAQGQPATAQEPVPSKQSAEITEQPVQEPSEVTPSSDTESSDAKPSDTESSNTAPFAPQPGPPAPGVLPPFALTGDMPMVQIGDRKIPVKLTFKQDVLLEEAKRKLLARWNEIRSVSARVRMKVTYNKEEGRRQRHDALEQHDCMKKDGKLLVRSYRYSNVIGERPEYPWILTGQRLTKVFDGDYLYTIDVQHDGTKVTKSKPDPRRIRFIGGEMVFVQMHRMGRVTLMPDKKIDGKSVYVFDVVSKNGEMKARYYMDKETGIRVKLVMERLRDNSTFTLTVTDIELNPEFSEDHFTFTPPEGAEIKDLTQASSG